jgi:hypothetical protein
MYRPTFTDYLVAFWPFVACAILMLVAAVL